MWKAAEMLLCREILFNLMHQTKSEVARELIHSWTPSTCLRGAELFVKNVGQKTGHKNFQPFNCNLVVQVWQTFEFMVSTDLLSPLNQLLKLLGLHLLLLQWECDLPNHLSIFFFARKNFSKEWWKEEELFLMWGRREQMSYFVNMALIYGSV